MRRSSFTATVNNKEPLIVVEESGNGEEEDEAPSSGSTPRQSLDIDSPVNPYLLSPWRDPRETRKHSLPTPQCTSGITASQVRRLSERGVEGPTPKEAAFLATLSQAPGPQPGGRRHSVVTISKVPSTLFGRSRRESIAAVPQSGRRDSRTDGPPSTDPRGSIHNLQLDIMDDIVQARKARMKLWNTSNEKVCEVQKVNENEASSPLRYTNRRYSDFIGSLGNPLPTIQSFRRASENPNAFKAPPFVIPQKPPQKTYLFSSNNLLSSLASSSIEINKCEEPPPKDKITTTATTSANTLDVDGVSKSHRSNSFDVSYLHSIKKATTPSGDESLLTGWFTKRHQPVSTKKKSIRSHSSVQITKDMIDKLKPHEKENKENKKSSAKEKPGDPIRKFIRDGKMAIVDSHILGNKIEGFLKRDTPSSSTSTSTSAQNKGAIPKDKSHNKKNSTFKSVTNWFSNKTEDEETPEKCDSSLCSQLKDLFVK